MGNEKVIQETCIMKRKFADFFLAKCLKMKEPHLRKSSSRTKICLNKCALSKTNWLSRTFAGHFPPSNEKNLSIVFCQPNRVGGAWHLRGQCSTNSLNNPPLQKNWNGGKSVCLGFDSEFFQNSETRLRCGFCFFSFDFRRLAFTEKSKPNWDCSANYADTDDSNYTAESKFADQSNWFSQHKYKYREKKSCQQKCLAKRE